jgi:cytochrome c biogenesis protein CcmG, thiol:disulfide interchange protein DsbE
MASPEPIVKDDDDELDEREDRPNPWRTALIVFGLAAGFALIPRLSRGCEGSLFSNDPAPDFSAHIVANAPSDAKELKLSELRGHPVVLDFWATWCGPCQAEAPIVDGLAQRYRDRGLVVVGVNTSDEAGLAERFVRRKGLTFPIVYDEGNAIAQAFKVGNLPTLIVVDKEGKIVAVRQGVTSESALEDLVKRVL